MTTEYHCKECGIVDPKWHGRRKCWICPICYGTVEEREVEENKNDYSTCTIHELWDIRRTYWSAMSDDDREAWQAAKDDKEAQELARQKQIMREQRKERQ